MDRMLYVAMSGARETLRAQASNNHNLANASTTGFQASLSAFQARQVQGDGFASRTYATNSIVGIDHSSGTLQTTGRDLDVAVLGNGFLTVQAPDGREAYTRAGNLRVDAQGQLTTVTGLPVMGDGGPISVPPNTSLLVGSDGTLSVIPQGSGPETKAVVGRVKLVDPPADQLVTTADGLLRQRDGTDAAASATVRLQSGVLESSNVNLASSMVNMIELARRFDLQVKAMRTAEDDAAAATQLLRSG
jgi:flagellar basal-body rod protein FlgF